MKILGIDPGLNRTGYGLIETAGVDSLRLIEAGVIRTSPRDGISLRVADIYKNLSDIIKEYNPRVLVLEKLFAHYKHPITSILMGHARGVICLACGMNDIRLVSYAATRIKKVITGNGRAGKHQVRNMVKSLLNLKSHPEPLDVSDALAIAISFVYVEGVNGHGVGKQSSSVTIS